MKKSLLELHPEIILGPKATLRQAVEVITNSQIGIVLVVGKDRRLAGILVDSDIRRAILKGLPLDSPVTQAMNPKPATAEVGVTTEELEARFREKRRAYIPIVDARGRVVDIASFFDTIAPDSHPNWVVIMAGGQGTRLRPFTNERPKPMMPVADKPLLELVLERLVTAGFRKFIFSVNYLAERIKDHFGDGRRWGSRVEYLFEKTELGTAGSLSLIERDLGGPFIVMNGDLLTKMNYRALLDFHDEGGHAATLCVKESDFQIPYGVVSIKDHKLASIVEKPVQRYFVNAGICVLEPAATRLLKKGERRDMPDLLAQIIQDRPGSVGCFPVQEYWLDIGKIEDYERAQRDYKEHF